MPEKRTEMRITPILGGGGEHSTLVDALGTVRTKSGVLMQRSAAVRTNTVQKMASHII